MKERDDNTDSSISHSGLALTSLQHRLITTALAALSLVVIIALVLGLFRALAGFVGTFSGILMPLAVAAILTMLLRPLVSWLESHTRLNRLWAVICLYALVILTSFATLWFLIPVLVEQLIEFIRALPALYESTRSLLDQRFPQILALLHEYVGEEKLASLGEDIEREISDNAQQWVLAIANASGQYLSAFIGLVVGLAVIPVYLFFFLRSDPIPAHSIEKQLAWIRKDLRDDLMFLGKHFADSIQTFFQGQILVGLIMGILLAVGFTVAGVNFGFLLGFMIGLMNIIPYLGTIIGLGTVLPIAFLQDGGGLTLALISLAIFVAVQVLEGYLLTPRIMGNRTGLHPLTIIIAIFFWGTALGGILGMILAIPLTAFFVVAWRLIREKYLNVWLA